MTSLKALLVFSALSVFAVACIHQNVKSPVPITSSEKAPLIPESRSDRTFDVFSHGVPEHAEFACDTCHQREGRSQKIEHKGHESCIGCHLNQFIARDDQVMCSICHADLKSVPPTQRAFPTQFKEGFNMKFDHATHARGEGRPPEGCAACHKPSGRGQTIPIGIESHATCYVCHTPDSKIGNCNVCHELAPYGRTLQSQYNFKAIFAHGDHRSLGCDQCHALVEGAPQGRQVTLIAIRQHHTAPGNNCLQCHNGREAFAGNDGTDVASCARCHKGSSFTTLPTGTVND